MLGRGTHCWEKLQNKGLCLMWTERCAGFEGKDFTQVTFHALGELGVGEGSDLRVVDELDWGNSILGCSIFGFISRKTLKVFSCKRANCP